MAIENIAEWLGIAHSKRLLSVSCRCPGDEFARFQASAKLSQEFELAAAFLSHDFRIAMGKSDGHLPTFHRILMIALPRRVFLDQPSAGCLS